MPPDEKMDVPAVLGKLNRALRLQYRSALQYLLASSGGKGTSLLALGQELRAYGEAEFRDAALLVSKIVALGGEPAVQVPDLRHHAAAEDAVAHLIAVEEEAIAALHDVIPDTGQEPRSEALEHLVEHLIMRKQDQLDFLVRAKG